jgi:mannan endo-1,4-beta-mannosidase
MVSSVILCRCLFHERKHPLWTLSDLFLFLFLEGFGLNTDSDGSYPFTYAEGLNFTMNIGIDTIDFGTLHLYPSSCKYPSKHSLQRPVSLTTSTGGEASTWGNTWIKAHGDACTAAGKPCLLEEYGYPSDHCSVEAPWQTAALDTKGIAADMFWQWGDTLSTGQTSDDGNTIFYGSSDFTCLVTDHVAAI